MNINTNQTQEGAVATPAENTATQPKGNTAYIHLWENPTTSKSGAASNIGTATVYCDGIKITGITVWLKQDGETFYSFPQRKGSDNKYYDIVAPCTKEKREQIIKLIEDALTETFSAQQQG